MRFRLSRAWGRVGLFCVGPLVLLWFFAAPNPARWMLQALDNSYPRIAVHDCPGADAILVLSGDGPPRTGQSGAYQPPNRSEAGLALYHAGRAGYLLFTDGQKEGEQSRSVALAAGIPSDRVLLLLDALDTADEARLAAERCQKMGWHRLILVTSGYHMGRAKLLVEHAAAQFGTPLAIIPFPADSGKAFCCRGGWRDNLPATRAFEHSARAGRELWGQMLCRLGVW